MTHNPPPPHILPCNGAANGGITFDKTVGLARWWLQMRPHSLPFASRDAKHGDNFNDLDLHALRESITSFSVSFTGGWEK